MFHNHQILFQRFAKSNTRIQNHFVLCYPCHFGCLDNLSHICHAIRQEISVVNLFPVMHQTAGNACIRDKPRHLFIILKPPYIIDQITSGLNSCFCHCRFVSIHRKRNIKFFLETCHNRCNSADLFFVRNLNMSRSCGFSANIDNFSAFLDHLADTTSDIIHIFVAAAIRKRIRCYI